MKTSTFSPVFPVFHLFFLVFLQHWQKIDDMLTEEQIVAVTILTTKAGIAVLFSLLCRRNRRGEVRLPGGFSCEGVAFFSGSIYLSLSSRIDRPCLSVVLMTFFPVLALSPLHLVLLE